MIALLLLLAFVACTPTPGAPSLAPAVDTGEAAITDTGEAAGLRALDH